MVEHIRRNMTTLLSQDNGVTSIEYALIAMLIALVIVAGATAIGANLNGVFASVAAGF